jgi:hypothetical protein
MNNANKPRFYKKKELASLLFPSFNPTIGWRMINTLCQDQSELHDLFHSKRQYVTPSEYLLIASVLGI